MATSATGGYLSPSSINGDLNDQALAVFLQALVVGIVGLPGPMVRPRWQGEPPNIPDAGVSWAAIGPGSRKRDSFSFIKTNVNGDVVSATVVRNRTMDILCSFYGPTAEANSELLAMGLEVPQNREAIQLQGFQLVSGAGDSTIVPVLTKQRYLYRVDIPFTIRQQQQYTYSVLTILEGVATIELQDAAGNNTVTRVDAKAVVSE